MAHLCIAPEAPRMVRACFALGLIAALVTPALATPPTSEADLSAIVTTSDTTTVTGSWLTRQPISKNGFYFAEGVQVENFHLGHHTNLPARLQSYAATLSLEYFVGDEAVAALILRPGLYGDAHISSRAWDVPFDAATGIPITKDFNGVIGVSDARFLHHPVPIVGVVWTASPRLRIEVLYPQPAVIFDLDRKTVLRLGGQVAGGGYSVVTATGRTSLEYTSYLVGLEVTRTMRPGLKLVAAVGSEVERTFDFFRQNRRTDFHGAGYAKIGLTFSR